MKPGIISALRLGRSIASMIVIAALALYVYDYFRKADRARTMDEAAVIREQTKALQAQAVEVNLKLKNANRAAAALTNEVAGQRADVAREKMQQQIAQALTEGIQLAQAARVAIAESYQTTLQLPSSNAAAGLPDAAQLYADSLQRLEVGRNGVVSLVYNERSGVAGGVIRLIPDAQANGMLNWRCETSSYPDIVSFLPQCRFIRQKAE